MTFTATTKAPYHPNPLEGYEDAPPLPTAISPDGKSLVNPASSITSAAYSTFPPPLDSSTRGGFDFHIYFLPSQLDFATALWKRIRYEFPELRIYKIFEKPIGPHTRGMFEVNVFTTAQLGALMAWLTVWRGELSVLMHPNTGKARWDHTDGAAWLGEKVEVKADILGPE